jgi:hypothetical protein
MIFGRNIRDDCQPEILDNHLAHRVKLSHVDRSLPTLKPIIANPAKAGDAKPWIYSQGARDDDSQVAEVDTTPSCCI